MLERARQGGGRCHGGGGGAARSRPGGRGAGRAARPPGALDAGHPRVRRHRARPAPGRCGGSERPADAAGERGPVAQRREGRGCGMGPAGGENTKAPHPTPSFFTAGFVCR